VCSTQGRQEKSLKSTCYVNLLSNLSIIFKEIVRISIQPYRQNVFPPIKVQPGANRHPRPVSLPYCSDNTIIEIAPNNMRRYDLIWGVGVRLCVCVCVCVCVRACVWGMRACVRAGGRNISAPSTGHSRPVVCGI
jgi:hypothetical protein